MVKTIQRAIGFLLSPTLLFVLSLIPGYAELSIALRAGVFLALVAVAGVFMYLGTRNPNQE